MSTVRVTLQLVTHNTQRDSTHDSVARAFTEQPQTLIISTQGLEFRIRIGTIEEMHRLDLGRTAVSL